MMVLDTQLKEIENGKRWFFQVDKLPVCAVCGKLMELGYYCKRKSWTCCVDCWPEIAPKGKFDVDEHGGSDWGCGCNCLTKDNPQHNIFYGVFFV